MRRKADGPAFEREFEDCLKDKFYVKRLPTLNTGYAGLSQPADFIVVGRQFNYVEVKETAGNSFSITTMQQYYEMQTFVKEKIAHRAAGNAVKEMNYWLIVHYLKRAVIKVISSEDAIEMSKKRKTLKFNSVEGYSFTSLKELKENLEL